MKTTGLVVIMMITSITCFPQNKIAVLNSKYINTETNDTIEIFANRSSISIVSFKEIELNTYPIKEVVENDNFMYVITVTGLIIKHSFKNQYTFIGQIYKDMNSKEINRGNFYKKIENSTYNNMMTKVIE